MTNAGWYPDPAGAPDTYRYWDGQSWSQMTTSHPPAPGAPPAAQPPTPPPGSAPTQLPPQPNQGGYGAVPSPPGQGGYGGYGNAGDGGYGGYGQQQWSPQPGSGGGSGKTIAIVVGAVLALVLIGVGGYFGVRAVTDDKDAKRVDGDPTPSESVTEETTGSTVVPSGIQCTGGTSDPENPPSPKAKELSGGGLTIPHIAGYTLAGGGDVAFSFPDAFVLQYASVEERWITLSGVGGLAKANGFNEIDVAAEVIMQCLTSSDKIYSGFTGREDLKNEAIDIDGKPAHRITAEVRVEDPQVTVEGDVVDVIVVDTGDPETYGLYIAMAPIADDPRIARNEDVTARISVD